MPATRSRYYYEYSAIDRAFYSQHVGGWQVYDRLRTTPEGAARVITFAVDRYTADLICAALRDYDATIRATEKAK